MSRYYVELFRPPYPVKQSHMFRVYHENKFNQDTLSPNLVALWAVHAQNVPDALANLLDALSMNECVKGTTFHHAGIHRVL